MKIVKVKNVNLENLAGEIKKGKVIIFPTDTVYGLITDATNKKAVDNISQIKKREKQKPIPIFVKDIKQAKRIAKINKNQEKFLKKAWPGKVTAILERKKAKLYGVDKKTIGLRVPKYNLILRLIETLDCPLTGTSANISGKAANTRIKEVIKQFKNRKLQPDLIIDAGNLKKSKPSKVIDLTGITPKVLRK